MIERSNGQRYSSGAILLHWLLAFALSIQLALGFTMPEGSRGFALYQLHKSIGITILLLTLVRIGWRLGHKPPAPFEQGLAGSVAKSVHLALYLFMIAAPLTGWALTSTAAARVPTVLFGTIPWPDLPITHDINAAATSFHEILGWIGAGLIALHVAGAARHQWLLREPLAERMAPAGSAAAAGVLAALVIAAGGVTLLLVEQTTPAGLPTADSERVADARGEPAEPKAEAATAEPQAEQAGDLDDSAPAAESLEAATDEPGAPPVWTIRPGGRLGFSVGSEPAAITGSFARWTGKISFDPDHPEQAADIRIDVDLASGSVGDATQDQMLTGEEFLATGAHPTATYRTHSVRQIGPDRYRAEGTLNLKGVSKAQALTFKLTGSGLERHVTGSATIQRLAFGIGTGSAGSALGKTVTVTFGFDAVGRRR